MLELRFIAGLEGISPDVSCGDDVEDELALEHDDNRSCCKVSSCVISSLFEVHISE